MYIYVYTYTHTYIHKCDMKYLPKHIPYVPLSLAHVRTFSPFVRMGETLLEEVTGSMCPRAKTHTYTSLSLSLFPSLSHLCANK